MSVTVEQLNQWLHPYVQRLELEWPIKFELHGDVIANWSDGASKTHNVMFVDHVEIDMQITNRYLPSFLHELCHAKLAESIDPLFAGYTYLSGVNNYSEVEAEKFNKRSAQFVSATHFFDIWVNDIVFENWPEIFETHINKVINEMIVAHRAYPDAIIEDRYLYLPAQYLADTQRHGLRRLDLSPVLKAARSKNKRKILQAASFYADLPRLSNNVQTDLELLEVSANKSLQIWGVVLQAEIVREDGIAKWKL